MFKSFPVASPADRLLLYLTLTISSMLKRLVMETGAVGRVQAGQVLHRLAHEQCRLPGEPGFPLGGLMSPPANQQEEEFFRAYLKQLREEVGRRLLDRVFASCPSDAPPSKYWLAFASRGFANRTSAVNL